MDNSGETVTALHKGQNSRSPQIEKGNAKIGLVLADGETCELEAKPAPETTRAPKVILGALSLSELTNAMPRG